MKSELVETIYRKCKSVADDAEEILTHCRALRTADPRAWGAVLDAEMIANEALAKLRSARNEMEFKSRPEAAE